MGRRSRISLATLSDFAHRTAQPYGAIAFASEQKKQMSGVTARHSYFVFVVVCAADCRRNARASRNFARKDIVIDDPLVETKQTDEHTHNSVVFKSGTSE